MAEVGYVAGHQLLLDLNFAVASPSISRRLVALSVVVCKTLSPMPDGQVVGVRA